MGRYTQGGVGRDMLAGALAGAAAIWVADKLDWKLWRDGGPEKMRQTTAARPGGMDPAHVIAKRAADKLGVDVGDPKDNPAGHAVHYGLAMGMGALYGLLRGMTPAVSTGRGALYGMAMFILQDEVANTVMGTGGNPMSYPVRDHARGAAAHTLFGVVTDLGTRLLSPWRDVVVIERGPPLSERVEQGRAYLEDARDYAVERGRGYWDQAGEYLDQGREYAQRFVEDARSRLPDVDVEEVARRGRRRAQEYVEDVRDRLPDPDDVVESGRKRAWRFADMLRSRMPDVDDVAESGRKHARRFAEDVRSRMPDVDDLADSGRKHARRFAKEARSRMPDPDDVAEAGRKHARRVAEEAQSQGSDVITKVLEVVRSLLR